MLVSGGVLAALVALLLALLIIAAIRGPSTGAAVSCCAFVPCLPCMSEGGIIGAFLLHLAAIIGEDK